MTAVTPTDRPKSVRNSCVIKVFGGVFYVVTLLFGLFCGCRGFCHRTESDLFLFLLRGTWATEGEFSRETYQYNSGANLCHTEFDKIPVTIRPLALGAKRRITASSFGSVVMY